MPPSPLATLSGGIPPVHDTPTAITEVADRLAAGCGPVGVDTERASGIRYFDRAQLVQVSRRGSGTFLIDPLPHPGALARLATVVNPLEWILHAADQDLPCLAEIGLRPASLADTELAGRLLGLPRVGLAGMVDTYLGLHLPKGHGASDWSRRPLPDGWRTYAALDVELLPALWERVAADLDALDRRRWAAEEFEAIRTRPPVAPRSDPWRRTSRITTLRTRRELAVLRELWYGRDAYARERDRAPRRVLPDSALVTAATACPRTAADLLRLPDFGGPRRSRLAPRWIAAIERAIALPESELPSRHTPEAYPHAGDRRRRSDPAAADRLGRCRAALAARADLLGITPDLLLQPTILRDLCWRPGAHGLLPQATAAEMTTTLRSALRAAGARPWQLEMTVPVLAGAFPSPPLATRG